MANQPRTRRTAASDTDLSPLALRQRKRQRLVALVVVFATVVPLLATLFRV